jgi:hypothetical protein
MDTDQPFDHVTDPVALEAAKQRAHKVLAEVVAEIVQHEAPLPEAPAKTLPGEGNRQVYQEMQAAMCAKIVEKVQARNEPLTPAILQDVLSSLHLGFIEWSYAKGQHEAIPTGPAEPGLGPLPA